MMQTLDFLIYEFNRRGYYFPATPNERVVGLEISNRCVRFITNPEKPFQHKMEWKKEIDVGITVFNNFPELFQSLLYEQKIYINNDWHYGNSIEIKVFSKNIKTKRTKIRFGEKEYYMSDFKTSMVGVDITMPFLHQIDVPKKFTLTEWLAS